MRIIFIADTHEKHKQVKLPDGDVLIHAGDLTWVGKSQPTLAFLDWLEVQPFKHKIFVAGNHDFYFHHAENLQALEGRGFTYLMNSGILIENRIKIWGSPLTPEFLDWAFMGTPAQLKAAWKKIPDRLDLLITHGPPFGILDRTTEGVHAGCRELLKAVQIKKPKFHVFGHIHEGYGIEKTNATTFVNASLCNADYNLVNPPVVVDF